MKDINLLLTRQVKRWNEERKKYLEGFDHPGAFEHPAHLKPVVTVSRQLGCRGLDFGRILAHELHYGLFDRDIVEYISKHMGVSAELVESLDEKDRSGLELWIEGLLHQHVFDADDYIRALCEVIKTISLQGGVVILGRGANFLLKGTNAFHVRLIASPETRIKNLVTFENYTDEDARAAIEKSDRERKQYIKKYFKEDIDNQLAYDVVINMDKTTLDPAVKIILTCMRARGYSVEDTGGDKRKKVG
jgi:cytidylate kinase